HIGKVVIRLDETIALHGVEPFDHAFDVDRLDGDEAGFLGAFEPRSSAVLQSLAHIALPRRLVAERAAARSIRSRAILRDVAAHRTTRADGPNTDSLYNLPLPQPKQSPNLGFRTRNKPSTTSLDAPREIRGAACAAFPLLDMEAFMRLRIKSSLAMIEIEE